MRSSFASGEGATKPDCRELPAAQHQRTGPGWPAPVSVPPEMSVETLRMRAEPLSGAALRTLALSLAWELSDLAARGQVYGALDPDHVVCRSDGVAVLVSRPTAAQSSSGVEPIAWATDIAGWGRTVTYAATGRMPRLGSHPDLPDAGLARIITRTIAVDPSERPDAAELELLLMELDDAGAPEWGPTPEDAANFFTAFALLAAMRREEQALKLPWLRAGTPSDLLQASALGVVLRVFPTHLRFWAMIGIASLAAGMAILIAGLRSNNPVLWSPGLVFTAVGLGMMPWLVKSWGMSAVIFEHGFGLTRRTRRWIAKWEDVAGLRIDVRRRSKSLYASVQISATLDSGERLHIPRAVFGRQTLVLAAILERRTFLPRLAKAQNQLEQGGRNFGTVRLTPVGIEHGKATVPWNELTSVLRVPYNARGEATTAIEIRGRGARGETVSLTIPEYRTWDARVLLTLLEERVVRQFPRTG